MRTYHLGGAVLALAIACGGGDAKTGGTTVDTFTFAPKAGTKYTRIARWSRELAVLDLHRKETLSFQWTGAFSEIKQNVVREEELTKIDVEINGQNVGSLTPTQPIKMKLTTDKNGHTIDIEGAQTLAAAITSLLPQQAQTAGTKAAMKDSIEDLLVTVQETAAQDVIGKPTKIGSEWDSDNPAEKRHFKVTGMEACPLGTCTRVTGDITPQAPTAGGVQDEANDLIVTANGVPIAKLVSATVGLHLSGLFDPATMMVAQSTIAQTATYVFETAKGQVTVQQKGSREVEWRYEK